MTTPVGVKPKLPATLTWSDWWKDEAGLPVEGDREMPIDRTSKRIAGWMQLCPAEDCGVEEWFFEQPPPRRFCPEHGHELVEMLPDSSTDPVGGARLRLWAHAKQVLVNRRMKAAEALRVKAAQLRDTAAEAATNASREAAKHKPSAAISAGLLGGGLVAAALAPQWAMVGGGAVATVGAVAVYGGAYAWRSYREGGDLVGRAARKAREFARHVGAASAAFGAWLAQAGLLGVDLSTVSGRCLVAYETLSGCALAWAVNRSHWEFLWAERRRLAELARAKAESATRAAEAEADRLESLPLAPPPVEVEETPEAVGLAMAARWQEIARSSTVPPAFLMAKTWIIPAETREVVAPIDDVPTRIGWEFAIQSEPGALVSRMGGMQPPLVAAREWLAAMLERDPAQLELIDRPGGVMNRGLLIVTERASLGGGVAWKGRAGVRRTADGTIFVHIGRTITGDDAEEAIYTPGQPFGGQVVGHVGGGKSAGVILALLNDLAAGIFPVMFDPKQLVDYADFVGVLPIGVTVEHRDVILRSLHAERERRERHLAARPMWDRYGRKRTQQSLWNPAADGPPIHHFWEEFHTQVKDQKFIGSLAELFRLQRAAAMGGDVITQGGGLADFADSVMRGILGQTRMRLYRMPDNLARLAGYTGLYMPSQLPRMAGMCLTVMADGPTVPLRSAFVTREDVDGSVYDQLYAPDGSTLLAPPPLPAATVEVFEREGLMDLWRLGQGSDGLTNLLADRPREFGGPVPAPAGARMGAADVLLAIVMSNPGCDRKLIDAHAAWTSAPGWSKAPAPSTVSRAASELEKVGLLSRNKNDGTDYRVLPAGDARAVAALAQALVSHGQANAAAPSAAEVEAAAERTAEEQDEKVGS